MTLGRAWSPGRGNHPGREKEKKEKLKLEKAQGEAQRQGQK